MDALHKCCNQRIGTILLGCNRNFEIRDGMALISGALQHRALHHLITDVRFRRRSTLQACYG